MRVTNSMMVSTYLNNLNTNLNKMSKLQTQMANGRKYASISDDPVSAIYSMQAQFRLDRLDRYQKSLDMSKAWLTQAETSLSELNGIYTSMYETVINAATNVKTDDDRANMAQYVKEMRDQVLQALNTSFGDRYIFAGFNTTGTYPGNQLETPFIVDANGDLIFNGLNLTKFDPNFDPTAQPGYIPGYDLTLPVGDPLYDATAEALALAEQDLTLYNKLQGEMKQFWVGNGLLMDVQVNGIDLVGTGQDNLYSMLDNLYKTLTNTTGIPLANVAEELQKNFVKPLQDKQSELLAITASIGGRTNRLEMLADRYEMDFLNYTQIKSDAEDADLAELYMNFTMAQSVYNAALAAGQYVIQQTLMDFLR